MQDVWPKLGRLLLDLFEDALVRVRTHELESFLGLDGLQRGLLENHDHELFLIEFDLGSCFGLGHSRTCTPAQGRVHQPRGLQADDGHLQWTVAYEEQKCQVQRTAIGPDLRQF